MSSRKYVQIADIAVAWGLALVRFDFRVMGESTGGAEDMTLSGRLEDARAVVDYLKGLRAVDATRLGLLGSSLGGVVAWATALAEPSVRATAVWATPCHLQDLLARRGRPAYAGAEPLPDVFFEDLEGHSLMELPGGLSRVLIVHGEADELVPVEHAHRLYAQASDPKRLIILPGVDHRITDTGHRKRAAEATIQWLASYLREP
jgi:dienelactone hydrolase